MHDGRVSIVAKDATLRQILAEWAKVGQTKILNGDRVPGGPLTLQLNNVPEAQALDTLLRTVSGYLASPRAEFVSQPVALRSHRDHADAGAADVDAVRRRRAAADVPQPPAFQRPAGARRSARRISRSSTSSRRRRSRVLRSSSRSRSSRAPVVTAPSPTPARRAAAGPALTLPRAAAARRTRAAADGARGLGACRA